MDRGAERVAAGWHAVALGVPSPASHAAPTAIVRADHGKPIASVGQARSDALAGSIRHGGRLRVCTRKRQGQPVKKGVFGDSATKIA